MEDNTNTTYRAEYTVSEDSATSGNDKAKAASAAEAANYSTSSDCAHSGEAGSPKKLKPKFPWLRILAMMLVCVLLGGAVGGLTVHEIGMLPPNSSNSKHSENDSSVTNMLQNAQPKATEAAKTLLKKDSKLLTPAQIGEKASLAVVAINTRTRVQSIFGQADAEGAGSGVLISPDGTIVTNNHVINNATSISVNLANGKKYDAEIVGQDPTTDLAVIKIKGKNFPYLSMGDSAKVKMGDQVVAIGNPLGELEGSLTVGYISATNRNLSVKEDDGRVTTMYGLLQTDAAINRGNSGGALINMYGELIGINSMKTSAVGVEGLGFAIPVSTVRPVVDDLVKYGKVNNRPSIGITGRAISDEVAREYEYPKGIYVLSVLKGSPAEKAGLKKGDVITAINGKSVASVADINGIKVQLKAGDVIKVQIYRNGDQHEVSLTLAGEN